MTVAEGIAARAATTAHQHGGGRLQLKLTGDQAGAEVGAIAVPAVAAASATAEQDPPSGQLNRLGTGSQGSIVSNRQT